MLVQPAEDSFQKGLVALEQGRRREALALFEAAVELERRLGHARPQPRYLSYYGLCLALERNAVREGLQFCREAVTHEGYNADLRCNLARVLLAAGRRREAYDSFLRGLGLQPDHSTIVRELRRMGVRRRPVLPFLGRDNPLNIFLGRLRARSGDEDKKIGNGAAPSGPSSRLEHARSLSPNAAARRGG